jgi:outer membrane protein OmpA-like peptidoglycan-associated protein
MGRCSLRAVLHAVGVVSVLGACGAPPPPVEPIVVAVAPSVDAAAPAIAPSGATSEVVDRRPIVFSPPPTGTRLGDDAIIVESPIAFAVGGAKLLPESDVALDAVRDILIANPRVTIDVQVHTDSMGTAAYNLALSAARADAVARALERRGIDSARITAHGFGDTRPLVPNDTPGRRAVNRRVAFVRTDKR